MRSYSRMKCLWTVTLMFGLIGGGVYPALAVSLFSVSLDTSALSGIAAQLAFDLTDSDPAANVATIATFSTDGSLGAASTIGGPVTGVLPGTTTIADTAFFNELLQDITLGDTVTFTLGLTENSIGGGLPDQFAFFLLDAVSGLPLFSTADLTGADALFTVDITGATFGDLQVFAPTSTSPAAITQVTPVPESASFVLIIAGLGGLAALRRWPRGLRTARMAPRGRADLQLI